ncbi:inner membrane component of tripartite multidrug resistance system [Myroides odoratimimus]|uniref:hypothetical protein n=1 Tax=Myroides odoratimimus TaxID=76832 RepID=UPI000352DDC7|nr:hypothetical protein [Myroides odoratimimus]EPH12229.1 hypothetical protein HMPREF9713_01070 [Myroides odoratimimus CCUG 12700]MDM1067284.1 hypothetical protein [Myroides odoratimimus]MDM1520568.1 hypothetical protein [Myroides odoratimimus]STZ48544.1 Uncharacterised protein [Myroides odoratimimus]GAQ13294.1 inner membrane component of tripartite multidrug resistance system [Myroides odoratimimus]
MYNKGLFKAYVSEPLQFIIMFVFGFVLVNVYAVYPGNAAEIYSTQGWSSGVISSANNTMIIGMALTFPIIIRVKMVLKAQTKLFWGCLLLAALSFVSIYNTSYLMLLVISFSMGVIKMNCLSEFTLLFITVVTQKTGAKVKSYAYFYAILYAIVAMGTFLAIYLAYGYSWERTSVVFAILLIFCAILSLFTVHTAAFSRYYPLYYIDWFSVVCLSVGFALWSHLFAFLQEYNWFYGDYRGFLYLSSGLILIVLGVFRQRYLKRQFWQLFSFRKKNVKIAAVFIFILGVYQGASGFDTTLMSTILHYDNLTLAKVNLAMLPGSLLAGAIGLILLKNNNKGLKTFILLGFGIFILQYLISYFYINPYLTITYFYFTHFMRALAIGILYIGLWHYLTMGLALDDSLSIMSLMLIVRTFLALAVFSAIYSYLSYYLQKEILGNHALFINYSFVENSSNLSISFVQQQALIASFKTIYGMILLLSIPVVLAVSLHGFGVSKKIRTVQMRRLWIRLNSKNWV